MEPLPNGQMDQKIMTELLLPAGNPESFRAAIKGGANAVYLGIDKFNARRRAGNFTKEQLPAILKEARENDVKVYLTLNTVIRNNELLEIYQLLEYLMVIKPDAVIVQDWGVFYLIRKFFPGLKIHASTQMAIHNGIGVTHARMNGATRIVLARELTQGEIEKVASNTEAELEVFVHGALCYSFSGQCYFSSYIGGRGANRGLCSQSCRMAYSDSQQERFIFNLKDNQQVENIEKLASAGIHSLKVEGRMKSADYVYQVARSYRMALDDFSKAAIAKKHLENDFGREKTSWFMGKDVVNALTDEPNTGKFIGKVSRIAGSRVYIQSDAEIQNGDRLKLVMPEENVNLRVDGLTTHETGFSFQISEVKIKQGCSVFWVGRRESSFPSRLPNVPAPMVKISGEKIRTIKDTLAKSDFKIKKGLYIRIDHSGWLNFFRDNDYAGIIISLTADEIEQLNFEHPFLCRNKEAIIFELPKFISENQVEKWKLVVERIELKGFKRFFVSHLSQKLLLSPNSVCYTNEQVYVFNDAAAFMLAENQVHGYCYPVENDLQNLESMGNKHGIVILHSIPELFYSRMPVALHSSENKFSDLYRNNFKRIVKQGITIVLPEKPFNIFHLKKQLEAKGFGTFMIDLKHYEPSLNFLKKCMVKYLKGERVEPSTVFNYKRGLL